MVLGHWHTNAICICICINLGSSSRSGAGGIRFGRDPMFMYFAPARPSFSTPQKLMFVPLVPKLIMNFVIKQKTNSHYPVRVRDIMPIRQINRSLCGKPMRQIYAVRHEHVHEYSTMCLSLEICVEPYFKHIQEKAMR